MFRRITLIDFARLLAERAKARNTCPYSWTPSKSGAGRGFYMSSVRFAMASHGAGLRLRIEPANDHLEGSNLCGMNGYYCDLAMDDTLQPIVARLPRGRGFLAGWTMGLGMCATLAPELYADAEEAARAAHALAESDAEKRRDEEEAGLDEVDA